jgi:hypothetical protein
MSNYRANLRLNFEKITGQKRSIPILIGSTPFYYAPSLTTNTKLHVHLPPKTA